MTGLTIAEAARQTGLSVHTLRFYERTGLLANQLARTATGRRRYHEADLEWITICARLRATGMSIQRIRRDADLVRAGAGNEAERLALLEEHRTEVDAKLGELRDDLELINYKINVYRDHLTAGHAHQLWAVRTSGIRDPANR
jgi:DNA-binding transcriptional MerR regulator